MLSWRVRRDTRILQKRNFEMIAVLYRETFMNSSIVLLIRFTGIAVPVAAVLGPVVSSCYNSTSFSYCGERSKHTSNRKRPA